MVLDPFWVTDPVGTMLKVGNSLSKLKKKKYLARYIQVLHVILEFFFKSWVKNTQLEAERIFPQSLGN